MTDIDRVAYPFESRTVDLPAGRIHYVDEGRGEPILFVHGTPTWSFEWRHLIRAFATSHRCVALDHLGFGLSERPRTAAYTPEAHGDNLTEFVDRLNLRDFTLVVHDFGEPIALPLCFHAPSRVHRLVVINSWMWSLNNDPDMRRKARVAGGPFGRLLYRYVNLSLRVIMPSAYGDRRKLTPEIHKQYLDRFPDRWSRGAVLWPLAHALLASSDHYDRLWEQRARLRDRPALLVWGMKDSAFQPHQLTRWQDALPHARVTAVAEAGHWPHEEAPVAVIDAIRAFLS